VIQHFFLGVLWRQIALKSNQKFHSFQVKKDTAAGCNIEASQKRKGSNPQEPMDCHVKKTAGR